MPFRWDLCSQLEEHSQNLAAKDVESWNLSLICSSPVLLQQSSGLKLLLPPQQQLLPPHDRSPRLANISWKKAALPPLGIISSPLIPWLMWNLWTVRNKLVFESKVFQVEDIVSKAVAEARVWEDANSRKKKVQGRSPLSG